jgi:glycosyltransferase involved in cell wall biosynthesis
MFKNHSVCVVIPVFNEGTQIIDVIETIPDYVDAIVVVDDASSDNTVTVINQYKEQNNKVVLFEHDINQGCGGSLATGYKWARDNEFDVAVRMDGDGQMNPDNLEDILLPVVEKRADYSKGNRLFTGEAYKKIPKVRYFGNAFLSLITKIASGYWHIADFQSGYTAINKKALHSVDWDMMYKRYGQPNDLLIRLNVYNFRVADVPVEPVYNVGEKSGIKYKKIIFTLSWLLLKMFFWRLKEKYIIRDFHPLIFFYFFGWLFGILTMILFIRIFFAWYTIGHIPPINALAAMFSFMSSNLFTLFAMWFDMEANKELKEINIGRRSSDKQRI